MTDIRTAIQEHSGVIPSIVFLVIGSFVVFTVSVFVAVRVWGFLGLARYLGIYGPLALSIVFTLVFMNAVLKRMREENHD